MLHSFDPSSLLAQGSYIFPNERNGLTWGILIVLYPYITGLVAGTFILASIVRVFNNQPIRPVYRLAVLACLAFLICTPLPLLGHLGHPERGIEIMMTPHVTSAMAIFGFEYAWYLLAVVLLVVYFEFRRDMVLAKRKSGPIMKFVYTLLTLGVDDISPKMLAFDDRAEKFCAVIGVPSTVLLHGYVGFIFGSMAGNPWWSSVLMPVIFLCSSIVAGIAMVWFLYMITTWARRQKLDYDCVNAIGRVLMYALIFDLTLEVLDIVQRIYEAGEWMDSLRLLSSGYLYYTIFGVQLFFGGIVPLVTLGFLQSKKISNIVKTRYYFVLAILVQIGVFAMRWNVVIGGQLSSKSFQGLVPFHPEVIGKEGFITFGIILTLPFAILFVLTKLLPPWNGIDFHDELPPSDAPVVGTLVAN
jgi:Ni/Fe-hydrogenase subunit HybB-like protein